MASLQEETDARNAELNVYHEKLIASQERTLTKMDAWPAEMMDG
jgi:hypothetical protein